MTNVFKNFGMAMVAILMVVGFSAFKVSEMLKLPTENWYEVGPRVGDPHTLEIKGLFSGTPIEGYDPDGCATDNNATTCALLLEVGPLAPNLVGADISMISSFNDVEEKGSASRF